MRRIVVIVPHWLAESQGDSVLRGNKPGFDFFVESGTLEKCSAMPPDPAADSANAKGAYESITPEAAWLGLRPESLTLQDGPLMVSALGADPPERSVHFHLSLMSLVDGVASTPSVAILEQHVKSLIEAARRLNTRRLTIVEGEGLDHALVWEEGSLELGTVPRSGVDGKEISNQFPEGDGEAMLRRFIDDSINLLSALAFSHEREQEGLPPLNLLWPWGQGFRVPVPNLAIRRGEPCLVASNSFRLQGLTRLAGYKHSNRNLFGSGLKTNFKEILDNVKRNDCSITIIDTLTWLRRHQRLEEADWFTNQTDEKLFQPLVDMAQKEPLKLTVIAPGGYTGAPTPVGASDVGLILSYNTTLLAANNVPFDERALEERLPTSTVAEAVASGLV